MTRKSPIKNARAVKLPNGARAVMADRKEAPDSLDYFPTPPWATRSLVEIVFRSLGYGLGGHTRLSAWEPACGEGHMAEVLCEYFGSVAAMDVHDYGYRGTCPVSTGDFLTVEPRREFDWIITNPPYITAEDFARRALNLARHGVALFVRVQFLETIGRYQRLFQPFPPTLIAYFTERVPLCKGKWDPTGSTATAYCWLVWIHGREPMAPFWIPPGQRKALTRPDDIARFAAWSLPQQEAAE